MANITNNQTKIKVTDAPEYIPDGPALLSDPAVHMANVDQRLEAIKENRSFWDKVEPPRSKRPLIPAKVKAAGAALVAAGGVAYSTDNMPLIGGEDNPQKTRVITVQPGERLSNVVNRAQGGDEEIRPEVTRLKNEIGTDIVPGQKVEVRVED